MWPYSIWMEWGAVHLSTAADLWLAVSELNKDLGRGREVYHTRHKHNVTSGCHSWGVLVLQYLVEYRWSETCAWVWCIGALKGRSWISYQNIGCFFGLDTPIFLLPTSYSCIYCFPTEMPLKYLFVLKYSKSMKYAWLHIKVVSTIKTVALSSIFSFLSNMIFSR